MQAFACFGTDSGPGGSGYAFREVNAYAVAGTDGGTDHLGAFRDAKEVNGYASMGFLQGGVELQAVQGYPHVLISFIYDKEGDFFERRLGYWPRSCLGDSGAFTVWTKGETIDLDAYIAWCHSYLEKRPDFLAISLDVIPGSLDGGAPTKAQQKKAMRDSLKNGDRLREAGVRIMEVFHWHEPNSYLDELLDRRQEGEVLGIGGLAGGGSIVAKREFCDSVFARVKERCGDWAQLPPIHGLGISPESPLAARYPWWSVDSSSWAAPAKFGRHVSRNGKRGGRDSRVGNRSVRRLYLTRVLEGWNRREVELTRMWEQRGISYRWEAGCSSTP